MTADTDSFVSIEHISMRFGAVEAVHDATLKVAAGRHDLSVIKVHDPRERALPNVGIINIKDYL